MILDGTKSMDDNTIVSYIWSQSSGPLTTFNPTNSVTEFTPTEDGKYSFNLIVVDDDFLASIPAEVIVMVESSISEECPPGTTGTFPDCVPIERIPVGGEIIPIESTSLLLAGAQTFSWMIPVILSGIGIGLFVFRKSENS